MSLDKFYTSTNIAKKFIDKINNICPLDTFDKIIEPSAGCGNILNFLPKDFKGEKYSLCNIEDINNV